VALRTVGVKLKAEFQEYVSGLETSAKVTDDFASDLEKAAKAGDETAVATEVFGKTAKTAAEHVEKLDREINSVEKELRQLAIAYAEAGTAAERADLDGAIARSNNELTKLKKNKDVLKDLIPSPAEAESVGSTIGQRLGSSIGDALAAAPVWAPAAAAATPLIAAAVSAGVIGGVGVGGVIGGVLLAARDPRVQAAGKDLGQNLLGELEKDADVFVAPVLKNIGKIGVAFHGMDDELQRIFANSSKFVDPLVNGILDGVHGLVDGIDKTMAEAGPVVDAVGRSFATLGTSAGESLSLIAGGSKSAARGLDDLSGTVGDLIVGIGGVVRAFTEVYGVLTYLPDKATSAWERYKIGVDMATAKTRAASTIAGTFASVQETLAKTTMSTAEAAGKAGMNMRTYADAMDEAASKGRSLYDSQTDLAQAFADAEKAVKQNGKTLDINSQKGRDNRKALSGVAEKLVATYDAYVKVNGEGAAAGKIADHNRTQFVNLARQFGLGAKAANDLADSMGLIKPKSVDVHVNTHDAVGRANAARDAINAIHGKTVNVRVSVTGTERLDDLGHRIGGYRAAGGPVMPGVPYVVGEHQAEIFVPTAKGMIYPDIAQYAASIRAAAPALPVRPRASSTPPTAMPSFAGPQKVIVENRNVVEFAGGPDAFGQLMLNVLRVRPGVASTMAQRLAKAKAT
jgi:ABC-type transporter Mla subunit MlaD